MDTRQLLTACANLPKTPTARAPAYFAHACLKCVTGSRTFPPCASVITPNYIDGRRRNDPHPGSAIHSLCLTRITRTCTNEPKHTAPLTIAKRLWKYQNKYDMYNRREKTTRAWAPNRVVYEKRQFKPYPRAARSIGQKSSSAKSLKGTAIAGYATCSIDVRLPIVFDVAYILLLLLSQSIAPVAVNLYTRKSPLTPNRRISRNR